MTIREVWRADPSHKSTLWDIRSGRAQVLGVERITRLEEAFKGLSKDISKIDQKLETTNEKLDKLLGRQLA